MIYLTKLIEQIFTDNDIYILKKLGDKILINEGYKKLAILNLDIKVINFINLDQKYHIYDIFKNTANDQILIECPDENALIYYNLSSSKTSILDLRQFKGILSKTYQWTNNTILLPCYNGLFYQLNVDTLQLSQVDNNFIKNNYTRFYDFYSDAQVYKFTYQINTINYSFIIKDPLQEKVMFIDYLKNQKKYSSYYPKDDTTAILFEDDFFIFIREQNIIIESNQYIYELHPDLEYVFLKGVLMKEENALILVALSTNWKKDKLTTFNITIKT